MNISIISAFPELYRSFLETSLIGRAQEKKIITISLDSFFSFVQPKERIDAPTFGPTAGMIIRPEVVERALDKVEKEKGKAFRIFFSPHGKKLDQQLLKELSQKVIEQGHLALISARYEGMDTRVEEEYADEIISVGDFVVMGGDIPAMLLLEGLLRLIPGVIGRTESVEQDSFSGAFVDYPEYTAPVEWKGHLVPEIVRSGHHAAIEQWRKERAAERTVLHHFQWLRSYHSLDKADKQLARHHMPPHYAVLMHAQVLIGPEKKEGTTSVTSIDIHDSARSAKTYDIKNFFIVTPLVDQQKIVQTLLDFWCQGAGIEYNRSRHEAVKQVQLHGSLDEVIRQIEQQEGVKPILIATSAQVSRDNQMLTYHDQEKVWIQKRPVLFIFGTGQGLSPQLLDRCDYLLLPLVGFTDFNHLSVRSAVAIIFDRWLGINPRKAALN